MVEPPKPPVEGRLRQAEPSWHMFLTPVLGGPDAPRYPVRQSPQWIGRAETCEIALLEPTVSRRHATIEQQGTVVVLEDRGSKHGTFVNSKRVSRVELSEGDILVFGLSLVLRLERSVQPLPKASVDGQQVSRPRSRTAADRPLPDRPAASTDDHPQLDAEQTRRTITQRKLAAVGAAAAASLPGLSDRLRDILTRVHAKLDPRDEEALLRVTLDMERLVEDFEIARPRVEPCDLCGVVDDAVVELRGHAAPRGVAIEATAGELGNVYTDQGRLHSALIDLGRAAIESAPTGSRVFVQSERHVRHCDIRIQSAPIGLSDRQLERIFDPFATLPTDWQPLGMGLLCARQTLLALGARLLITSSQGSRCEMTVRLPC